MIIFILFHVLARQTDADVFGNVAERGAQPGRFLHDGLLEDQRGGLGIAREPQHCAGGRCVRGVPEGGQTDPTAGGDHEEPAE